MRDKFLKGIIRILNFSGETAGTGFIASSDIVITCAHVLSFANPHSGKTICLELFEDSRKIDAMIDVRYWSSSKENDVAILRVKHAFSSENVLKLGTSVNISGHNFRTYGFPKNFPDGVFIKGYIEGESEKTSLLQLSSQEITEGVSGSPVIDMTTRRVVGIVTARAGLDLKEVPYKIGGKKQVAIVSTGRLEKMAFATPSHIIRDICPELDADDVCPYRGLLAFTEEDSQFFYGREKLVSRLKGKLLSNPRFLAVVGPSGSGKSSVIQAGLLPEIRKNGLAEPCLIINMRARGQILQSFQSHLASVFPNMNPSYTGHETNTFVEFVGNAINHSRKRLVVFIDQFEELFISSNSDIGRFTDSLLLLLKRTHKVSLILTIRSDFYSDLLQSDFSQWLEAGQVNVLKVSQEEMRDAITMPAKDIGLDIEPGLSQLIVDDLSSTSRSPLPLLQLTLTQLWERQHTNNLLTSECYLHIGRATGVLTRWAGETYSSFNDSEKKLSEKIFTRLVRCSSINTSNDTLNTRSSLKIAELEQHYGNISILRSVLRRLLDSRLIVSYVNNNDRCEYVEIVHDVLVQEWKLLRGWIKDNEKKLIQRDKIELAAEEWKRQGKPIDHLWQGKILNKAVRFRNTYGYELNISDIGQEFLRFSIARKRRNFIKALSFGLLAPLAITTFIGWQVREDLRLRQHWDVVNSHSGSNPSSEQRMSSSLGALHNAGKSFADVSIESSTFSSLSLENSDFQSANIQDSSISEVNFQNSDFQSANIQESSISEVNFQQSDLGGANLVKSRFSNVMFEDADLNRTDFLGAWFFETTFSGAKLTRADLSDTYFRLSDLSNTNISSAFLLRAGLTNIDLSNVNFNNSKLCFTKFVNSNLQNASMKKALLIGSDLRNANLRLSDLTEANLIGANIDNTDFRGALGLTSEQIKSADNWQFALYDPPFREELMNAPEITNPESVFEENERRFSTDAEGNPVRVLGLDEKFPPQICHNPQRR